MPDTTITTRSSEMRRHIDKAERLIAPVRTTLALTYATATVGS